MQSVIESYLINKLCTDSSELLFIHTNIFSIKLNKKEFFRSQIAAFLGTAVDYLTFFGFTLLTGVWYVYANIIAATLGAITNFLLGRYWAFEAKEGKIGNQAIEIFFNHLTLLIVNDGCRICSTIVIIGFNEAFNAIY